MNTLVITRPARSLQFVQSRRTVALATAASQVPVALLRDGEDGVLVVEAPGLDAAKDLKVALRADRLTVSGTRRRVVGFGDRESRFARTVVVPDAVSAQAVTARYEAGVLRVRIAGMFPTPVEPEAFDIAISTDVASAAADAQSPGADQGDQA